MKNAITVLVGCLLTLLGATAKADETTRTILAIGDSLTAGYGLAQDESFPARLEAELNGCGLNVDIHNAGVSGDTSSGGRSRLEWVLSEYEAGEPDLVILEFGANDALRGIEPSITRDNIAAMLETLTERDLTVLLAGMMAPPNMGREYEAEFNSIFPDLAAQYDVHFYPFFLDGVAAEPELNQDDGIHPNKKGVEIIVERMAPAVRKALQQ